MIERGEHDWGEFGLLDAQMHTNLTFRATIAARQKDTVRGGGEKSVVKEVKSGTNR